MHRIKSLATALCAALLLFGMAGAGRAESITGSFIGSSNGTASLMCWTVVTMNGAKPTGYLDAQTRAGVIQANISQISFAESAGASQATGVALGYYQASTGGSTIPTIVNFTFQNAPGAPATVSVTFTNYYTHQVFYSSGPLSVSQGHLTVNSATLQ